MLTVVTHETLVPAARALLADGWRLAQACATTMPDHIELTYSFARGAELRHLRLAVPPAATVPSLSTDCMPAVLYENEIHDLYGITFAGLTVDYGGQFYQTATAAPFAARGVPR